MAQRTLTNSSARPARRTPARPAPTLVRVLDYERPLQPGSRHDLDDVQEVTFARGTAFTAARRTDRLALELDDARMSGTHARITRERDGWVIQDLGSRNGTFVDGARIERAPLVDGTIVELGRTAFVFRIAPRSDRMDVSAAELPVALPGCTTFSISFGTRLAAAARLARSGQSLVLHGETGTGKEVVARGVHVESGRSGPFIGVNCAALPANLIESELFGFRKGAFSGATEDRAGLIRSAENGTLFLDEIGDLPAATQISLLRVLQEKEVMPLGATRPLPVDVRVVAASHRDLEREVAEGRFREDLLARLAGYTIEVPPLRERREDLGLLIAALLARIRPERKKLRFSPEAGFALIRYLWPRNVRELEQALATAVALADDVVELEHLPPAIQRGTSPPPVDDLAPSETRRREKLVSLLATHRGNVAAVARAMGVARMQIHRWVERYGIRIDAYRA